MSGPYRWKGAIQFGAALRFNVIAKSAVRENGISFNKHHGGDPHCGGRLRQGPMICEVDGNEVEKDDQVRGFGGVSPVDEEHLEALEREASDSMMLDGLVPAAQVNPRFFGKSYDVTPDRGHEQAYVLFYEVLKAEDRVAIGKVVAGGKEYIVCLRPNGRVLAMEILYWPDELVPSAEAESAIEGVTVSAALIAKGRQLAAALAQDFAPERYRNEYLGEVQAYLDLLVSGGAPVPVVNKAKKSPAHLDLEDALLASLAAVEPVAKAPKRRKAAA